MLYKYRGQVLKCAARSGSCGFAIATCWVSQFVWGKGLSSGTDCWGLGLLGWGFRGLGRRVRDLGITKFWTLPSINSGLLGFKVQVGRGGVAD